ncbi:hypothetical protein Q3V23_04330 [Streptomyces sp. VNUA116]|uniref:hypothetical protein n=1 Tax=Streptomyces sp. VNUA116 TaxID=3062449 RepID=UPI002675D0B6|nr:hypothetical protein [Streptomyces sp. VNUA116]WKU43369.1 hypothetical protein Q3V23_04330 [Streptomyces sp. VNUA116]
MPSRMPLSTYRSRAAAVTAGCTLALVLGTAGAAGPAPVAAARAKYYTAAQVHSFLVKFYGQHGPSASDRINKVDAELRQKAAATKGQDVLLCARSAPRHIVVGKVTAEPSGMGWAPVTTRWKAGPDKHLTAYVGLKGSLPMKLYDVTCD